MSTTLRENPFRASTFNRVLFLLSPSETDALFAILRSKADEEFFLIQEEDGPSENALANPGNYCSVGIDTDCVHLLFKGACDSEVISRIVSLTKETDAQLAERVQALL
jgi:hypothetical protein